VLYFQVVVQVGTMPRPDASMILDKWDDDRKENQTKGTKLGGEIYIIAQ
jgi:hypothetical protein